MSDLPHTDSVDTGSVPGAHRTPSTERAATTDRYRVIGYRVATAAVVAEAAVGGIWDIARIPFVRDVVTHLGYPEYFLVLLGAWKLAAAIALTLPRLPLLKEWAYAGTFFVYTGAIVSHLTTGYARGEVAVLTVLAVLTIASWALRPAQRCLPGRQPLRMRS
ncbi:DoxX family protein [Nocardia veterana]|uniref:DoxX family protein n=1 Tax=Nocardia veterana TaxID=132249 RepID=A0A7X6LWJ5_9NOCA|nr:DoxX family protein [Nocardia veterana]NKY85914.1 DoxX family protein [Nocardia veterana]